jgi:glycosyltransferase involved in cell wall biosynthesis
LILSYLSLAKFKSIMKETDPQAVHIMVEEPMGLAARHYLRLFKIPFTTAYHTMFPEYFRDTAAKYVPAKVAEWIRQVANAAYRTFHSASEGVMVPTQSMATALKKGGYDPAEIRYWSHGVDTDLFRPEAADPNLYAGLQRPISIFAGRVAVEKNIEDFLKMHVPGTKVVVGEGPELASLKAKYPEVVFLGRKNYEDLPKYYASADTFVFPSVTDTFGLVQLEANATGVPVVAYAVTGPVDVITSPKQGVLAPFKADDPEANVKNLEAAWQQSQSLTRAGAREIAEQKTWERSTLEFLWFLARLPKKKD